MEIWLQNGICSYKMCFSFTKRDFWTTNGNLGFQFIIFICSYGYCIWFTQNCQFFNLQCIAFISISGSVRYMWLVENPSARLKM